MVVTPPAVIVSREKGQNSLNLSSNYLIWNNQEKILIQHLQKESNGISKMTSIIVDIDDTLIETGRRLQAVWHELLGRTIPLEAVKTSNLEQIFMKFASAEQKPQAREFQKRFWNILLCLEEVGVESLKLHEPLPFAANVLQEWSRRFRIVYLTGRTENMRSLTLDELKKFSFPAENTKLFMFSPKDFARAKGENPSGPTLVDARSNLLSHICENYSVMRAIDDYPSYFPLYKQFEIPDRIGLLRPKKYTPQHYLDRGATRVIEGWKDLQNT